MHTYMVQSSLQKFRWKKWFSWGSPLDTNGSKSTLGHLKALMPITFSSPWAQPEVVFFWYQMKALIFLIANPKFQLQILCSFGDITKSVKLNGIPENNFLCFFITASSPGVHTFCYLWRVNKKPQGETSQNAFQRSRSIN